MEIFVNNTIIESILEYGVLANLLLQTQLNAADKTGSSAMYGFYCQNSFSAASSSCGVRINFLAASNEHLTFDFAIPFLTLSMY